MQVAEHILAAVGALALIGGGWAAWQIRLDLVRWNSDFMRKGRK